MKFIRFGSMLLLLLITGCVAVSAVVRTLEAIDMATGSATIEPGDTTYSPNDPMKDTHP
jgi:hypothetical protein